MTWVLLACTTAPGACETMCEAATRPLEACLADWEASYSGLGYDDADDFGRACATWSFEMAHLEADARRRGQAEAGSLAATCQDRAEAFTSAPECATWTAVDWDRAPWEAQ